MEEREMGREVRRVPANWEHPKNAQGHYIPLFGRSFVEDHSEWMTTKANWIKGLRSDFEGGWTPRIGDELTMSLEDWNGKEPVESDYMPDWPESERTHFQMYEDTTEGTPISPVMATPEELAHWLADNNASAFGDMTATYKQWLATIRLGYAVSAVVDSKGLRSGVAAESDA
jgi:hypothetical protein